MFKSFIESLIPTKSSLKSAIMEGYFTLHGGMRGNGHFDPDAHMIDEYERSIEGDEPSECDTSDLEASITEAIDRTKGILEHTYRCQPIANVSMSTEETSDNYGKCKLVVLIDLSPIAIMDIAGIDHSKVDDVIHAINSIDTETPYNERMGKLSSAIGEETASAIDRIVTEIDELVFSECLDDDTARLYDDGDSIGFGIRATFNVG